MQGHLSLNLSVPEMWWDHVKTARSPLSHCAQLCECGDVGKDERSKEAAGSSTPPFHSAQPTSQEVCRPLRSWFTVTRAVVDFRSCSINFPGPRSGSFSTFCVICYCLGYKLDTDFDYVYSSGCSRLYYSKLLGLLPEASLLPSK